MYARSIVKKANPRQTPFLYNQFEFPKDRDGALYVRQSSIVQVQTNIHSFEMQTEQFVKHFRDMGVTGTIDIITDDEGMSGTLDMHERPGMSRMMKLIEKESIGWVGVVHVNRLFRDQWMINPDIFMKECYTHNVVVATLRMTFHFNDPYSQRVFRIEAEESARHLEWMKLILGGGRSTASDKGYYDGRYIVPGYIVDRSDPYRKRYIAYEPHARVVRWLYRRFLELDANFRALCHEVEAMPSVFPKFEAWVDPKTISRFSLNRPENITADGDYRLFRHSLENILTNPVYLGWWIPMYGGMIENNHEPIVEEGLFMYAHKRVSYFDLEGNRQKPARVTRNGEVEALLKKVISSPDGTPIYASRPNGGLYRCVSQQGLILPQQKFVIAIRTIDAVFLEKFFEHLSLWQGCEDWEDTIEQQMEERLRRETLIRKQIKDAGNKMDRILDTINTEGCPKSMKTELFNQYEGLEKKKAELEADLRQDQALHESNEKILYEIGTLLSTILSEWENLPFHQRLRFVNALVDKVFVSHVAPSWLKMEIQWKRLDWGVDVCHMRRKCSGDLWSPEEEELLKTMYATEDASDILHAFPERNWRALKAKGLGLGLRRLRREANSIPVNKPELLDLSLRDMEYAAEHGLALLTKKAQWSPSS